MLVRPSLLATRSGRFACLLPLVGEYWKEETVSTLKNGYKMEEDLRQRARLFFGAQKDRRLSSSSHCISLSLSRIDR